MRINIENLAIILSLIIFEAWFLSGYFSGKPEYEPAIGFLVSLSALFGKDKIKEKFGFSNDKNDHDVALFKEFQKTFPIEPTLRLLKEADFGNSFPKNSIQPLYEFVCTWDSVDKEFINKKLEKKKKSLYEAAEKLADEFSFHTSAVGMGDYYSVYPDNLRARGGQRPKHVIDSAKILNEKARDFIPKYESFIRTCNKVLNK